MASHTRSIKLPPDLAEAIEIRAKQAGYASTNAYVKGLLRYDLLVQGDHSVTLPISQSRPEEQDEVDAKLLRLTKAGKGERGQLLSHIVRKIAGGNADEVLKALPKKVSDEL